MKLGRTIGKVIVTAAIFGAGYVTHGFLGPTKPQNYLEAMQYAVGKDPAQYEQVIDQTREWSHQMKAQAHPVPTAEGYIPFNNVRLEMKVNGGSSYPILVVKSSGQQEGVRYMDGKLRVGPVQPEALVSDLEAAVVKNPQGYEALADRLLAFGHEAKAAANPLGPRDNYVAFEDVSFHVQKTLVGYELFLQNRRTSEEMPIRYVDGKTAVGTLEQRFATTQSEAQTEGKTFMREVTHDATKDARSFKDYVKDKATDAWKKMFGSSTPDHNSSAVFHTPDLNATSLMR
ncbi:hypothetical protein HZB02_02310 [Candidatus Woesearchaeota archaeon]|nr:hypothetical protein [Candidatus Woesearchaeota archaeon]